MTIEHSYGMQIRLEMPYEQAIEHVTAALKEQGFGVLTTIDVKQVMRQKLDKDFRKYVILGACNPNLSYQALSAEIEVGLLLPCNVIVYEDGEKSMVAIIDPLIALSLAGSSAVESVAMQAKEKLQRVLTALQEG